MAEERKIVYNVEVRTGDAQAKVDALAKSIDGLGNSVERASKKRLDIDGNAGKTLENIQQSAEKAGKAVGNGASGLSAEVKKAQENIAKFQKEYQDAMDGTRMISERTYRRHKALWNEANEILKQNGQAPIQNMFDFGAGKGFQELERRAAAAQQAAKKLAQEEQRAARAAEQAAEATRKAQSVASDTSTNESAGAKRTAKNPLNDADANATHNAQVVQGVRTYSNEISKLNTECEKLYRTYRADPSAANLANFAATRRALIDTEREYARYQSRIEGAGATLKDFERKAKSHFAWIATGAAIAGITAIPAEIASTMARIDASMASIRQVIPEIEANPREEGTPEFAAQQERMNKAMNDYIGIAAKYGASTDEVMEAARRLGRMYGQGENGPEQTRMLTDQAVKMAVADAFPVESAVKGLESAMSQWNLQSEDSTTLLRNSQYILDIWTKTAHNGAASAQDIGEAVENAGTAAAQAGISFDFFNSLVETGVRTTARSGNEIGQSIKSMMVSMQSEKSLAALEQWGIKTKEIGEDGKERMRSMQDIILDTSLMISTTDKDTQRLIMTLSGGRYQYSKVSAILKNYKEILRMQGVLNGDGEDGKQKTQGFTDRQVDVQLSTVKRKFAALKADVEGLFADIGKDGGIAALKWIADKLDDIVVGFRKIQSEGHTSFASVTGDAMLLFAGLKAIQAISAKVAGKILTGYSAARTTWTTSEGQGSAFGRMKQGFTNWKNDAIAKGTARGTIGADAANAASTNANTVATNANTGAEARNTSAVGANSVARGANTVKIGSQTMAVRNHNGILLQEGAQLTRNTAKTSLYAQWLTRLGVASTTTGAKMRVASVAARGLAAAETVATVASRVLSATLAAFGGIPGLIATAVVMLGADLLFEANAAGEAENATKRLKEENQEFLASLDEQYQLIDRQGKAAESLANQYNALADKIKSGALSDEEAKKADEELAEMKKTLIAIMGDEAIQFDENGKVKIKTIQDVIAKAKEETASDADNKAEEAELEAQQIENDINATKIQMHNTAERIRALENEVESCKDTANAYSILWDVITKAKIAMAQTKVNIANDALNNLENNGTAKDAVGLGLDEYEIPDDEKEKLRNHWTALRDEGQQEQDDAIKDAAAAGQYEVAKNALEGLKANLESYAADADNYQGTQEQQDKLAELRNTALENHVRAAEMRSEANAIKQQQGGETQGDTDDGKGSGRGGSSGDGGSGSSSPSTTATQEQPKQQPFNYYDDMMKATYNLAGELKNFGYDVPDLLAIAGRLNGINDLNFNGIKDPYKTGANDVWESAWRFASKLIDESAGKSKDDVMKALGIEGGWATIKNDADAMRKTNDFEVNAPHNGFADPYNQQSNGIVSKGDGSVYSLIVAAAQEQGIRPELLMGIGSAESGFDQSAVSPVGAIGVMQLMPDTAASLGVNPYDLASNIKGGAMYLKQMLDMFGGDETKAVAAYNAGPAAVKEYGGVPPYKETQDYVARVFSSNMSQYVAMGSTSAVSGGWDIDEKFLEDGYNHMDNLGDGCVEAVTKFGDKCDFLAGELSNNVVKVQTLMDDAVAKGIPVIPFDESQLQRGDVIVYDGNTHVVMADGQGGYYGNSSSSYRDNPAAGHTVHGSNFYEMGGETPTSIIKTGAGSSSAAPQGVGHANDKHPWQIQESFSVPAYEMKQAADKLAQSLHEASKAVLDFQTKVRGNIDVDTYKLRVKDAQQQQQSAEDNNVYWELQAKAANDATWSMLHDGKHDDVLKKIGNADFGKLPEARQTELAKDHKDLAEMVKYLQTSRDERDKSRNAVVSARSGTLDAMGYLNRDELVEAKLKNIDEYAEVQKAQGKVPEFRIEANAAAQKYEILKKYRDELAQTLSDALELSDAETESLEAEKTQYEANVAALEKQRALQQGDVDKLKANNAGGKNNVAIKDAEGKLGETERKLRSESDMLEGIKRQLETLKSVGNSTAQAAASQLNKVDAELAKVEKSLDPVETGLKSTIAGGFKQMFSDVLLEGKSFGDSFKDLWKSIAQYALQQLITIQFAKWGLGGLADGGSIGGAATGGSLSSYATGGIMGYAKGQNGGKVKGAGTGTSDSILAYVANKDKFVYLSNGEYVMTAEATQRIGKENLDRMNYGKYATGGSLSPTPYVPNLSSRATMKAQKLNRNNTTGNLEALMQEQTNVIRGIGNNDNGGGRLIVLNTQADSASVLKALQQNPRAVQKLLGRQQSFGFR